MTVIPKADGAASMKVLVSFGHHTFTRSFIEGEDQEIFKHVEANDIRCFCPDRYLASKGLPGLITTAATGKAYFSHNRNYMLVDQPLGGAPYAVFFNIERTKTVKSVDASMFVVSAYEKPSLPNKNRLPSISFATLVSKTVLGQPIKRPKK